MQHSTGDNDTEPKTISPSTETRHVAFSNTESIVNNEVSGLVVLARKVQHRIESLWADFMIQSSVQGSTLATPNSDASLMSIDEETENLGKIEQEIRESLEQVCLMSGQISAPLANSINMQSVFYQLEDSFAHLQPPTTSLVDSDNYHNVGFVYDHGDLAVGDDTTDSLQAYCPSALSFPSSEATNTSCSITAMVSVVTKSRLLRSFWIFLVYLADFFFEDE